MLLFILDLRRYKEHQEFRGLRLVVKIQKRSLSLVLETNRSRYEVDSKLLVSNSSIINTVFYLLVPVRDICCLTKYLTFSFNFI